MTVINFSWAWNKAMMKEYLVIFKFTNKDFSQELSFYYRYTKQIFTYLSLVWHKPIIMELLVETELTSNVLQYWLGSYSSFVDVYTVKINLQKKKYIYII